MNGSAATALRRQALGEKGGVNKKLLKQLKCYWYSESKLKRRRLTLKHVNKMREM